MESGMEKASRPLSISSINTDSKCVRWAFIVLDYFNMTEIGYELRGIEAPDPKTLGNNELWRNPKAFIQKNLSEAVIMTNWKGYPFLGGNPLFTWGDAVITDPEILLTNSSCSTSPTASFRR